MKFPKYDKETAAYHESGHACIACTAGLSFREVWVETDDNLGWKGKCQIESLDGVPQVTRDAFQLAGPLMQILCKPNSLGADFGIFSKSIFEEAIRLAWPNDDTLYRIGWFSDLIGSRIMFRARLLKMNPNAPAGTMDSEWLFELEREMRAFFLSDPVKSFSRTIVPMLITTERIPSDAVSHVFAGNVPPEAGNSLLKFLKTHSN